MLRRRLSYLLCLVLCAGCSRLPAQQGQPCRVTFSAAVPAKAGLPGFSLDDERNLQFYIFDSSGELVMQRGADPDNAGSCSMELPPDTYIWRVSAGDSPAGCATVEEYEAHMPSFSVNGYSGGFPMSAGGILMAGSGHSRVDAVLARNYSRIIIRSLSVADGGNSVLLSMRSLRLDRIFLMGVPDRVHMDGRSADGEPGCRLLNCWNGSATDFCGGSMERCTVAMILGGTSLFGPSSILLGTTLYCLPSTSAGIVVECSGMDMLGHQKTMFWTFRMPFMAGCSYECDILLAGEGSASPAEGGGCPGAIDIEVTDWVESGGGGYCSGRSTTNPLYLAGELQHPGDCADVDFMHIYGDTDVHPQDSSVVRSIGAGKHWKLFAVGAGRTAVYINDGLNLREIQFDIQ